MKENETKNLLMQVFCKNFKDDYIKESFENAICNQCARRNPAVPTIGTVKECRKAMEKQKEKKILNRGQGHEVQLRRGELDE